MAKDNKAPDGNLAGNRKAFHDYHVMERYEAGIELTGTEVKSCRARNINLADSFVSLEHGQAWLLNVHIAVYSQGNRFNHSPKQRRRLLLHKKEILKISQQVKEKGLTVIPVGVYLKGGLIKVEIAICKGKTHEDQRETLRQRQDQMEMRRALSAHR